jgi:hypothetical protein
MAKKEIALLKKQVEKLDNKGFDLEAWKKYTIVLLARIFGEKTEKIRQIESIEYDFSSWALRDTTGASSYMETCKKLGKEILEASIDELEHFGLPQSSEEENAFYDLIFSSLEDELKGIQVKEIKALLTKLEKKEVLVEDVREKLLSYGPNVAATVLANILSDQLFIKELNK